MLKNFIARREGDKLNGGAEKLSWQAQACPTGLANY
jgi:hypothetical protein